MGKKKVYAKPKTVVDKLQDKKIAKIEAQIEPELKHHEYFSSVITPVIAGSNTILSAIPQGVTGGCRIGDDVQSNKLELDVNLWHRYGIAAEGATGGYSATRCVVYLDKFGAGIDATTLLDDATQPILSRINQDLVDADKVTVLYDKTYITNPWEKNRIKFKVNKTFKRKIVFPEGSTAPTRNRVNIAWYGDSDTYYANCQFRSKLYFTDM